MNLTRMMNGTVINYLHLVQNGNSNKLINDETQISFFYAYAYQIVELTERM